MVTPLDSKVLKGQFLEVSDLAILRDKCSNIITRHFPDFKNTNPDTPVINVDLKQQGRFLAYRQMCWAVANLKAMTGVEGFENHMFTKAFDEEDPSNKRDVMRRTIYKFFIKKQKITYIHCLYLIGIIYDIKQDCNGIDILETVLKRGE